MFLSLLNPDFGRAFLSAHLPRLDGRSLSGLCLYDAAAGRNWWVQYLLPRECGELLITIQSLPEVKVEIAYAAIHEQLSRHYAGAGDLGQCIAAIPSLNILISPYPLDYRLEYLAEANDPARIGRLGAESPGFEGRDCMRVLRLRYVPGHRCQMRWDFKPGPAQQIFAKMFRDSRGAKVFQYTRQVADMFAANGNSDVGAPRPLAWLPDWNLLTQEKVDGTTFYHLLLADAVRDQHLLSTARSLACLHAGQVDLDTSHLAADEVGVAERACADLSAVLPTERFAPVLDRLRERAALIQDEPLAPIHRDFYDKQVLVGGAKTYLIDFDTLTLGSRELDLGNFIAHLHLRNAHRGCAIAGATDAFVEEYERYSCLSVDPLRLSYYLATAYFRLACKYRIRQRSEFLVERLLALAKSALGRRVAA